jgi:2-polyprenyl-3-methyl-5-hydroxy-6-metoxy-1,4-benzoquinol methylase
MSYRPQEFWEERLQAQFDLRGTGEPQLSLDYNRACYRLRGEVLDRALRDAGMDVRGKSVLDVGCGTGFFTEFYLRRGARVTGLDIASTSIARLAERFPEARFVQADVSEASLPERYDVVNAFDVLYHITDPARWKAAVERLAAAVAPGGLLLATLILTDPRGMAAHNRADSLERYRAVLDPAGVTIERLYRTQVLLNHELGPWRFLNRAPGFLYAIDRALLGLGFDPPPPANKLLVGRSVG